MMPHSEVMRAYYKRNNGHRSVTMLVDSQIGFPYGKISRVIMAWVTTQAKLTGSPELTLGRSLNEFAKKLGLSISAGKRGDTTRLKEQATRLFSTVISIGNVESNRFEFSHTPRSEKDVLLWRPGRWEGTITLSAPFYQHCLERAVPFDLRVMRELRSPFSIDLYLWLTWRFFSLRRSTLVPWARLRTQFGPGYKDTGHFREVLGFCLRDVSMLYPAAKVVMEETGLRLYLNPPHVRALRRTR
jgi:hypothetical protein